MASKFTIEDRASSSTPPTRNPVSWRSILVGLAGVCFICGLTAFNDYVVGNTYMVGNFLPVGLVMLLLVFIFAINAPLLWKWAPRFALSQSELAVAMGMALVTCALPSSGLMRYLPPHLVAYQQQAANDPAFANYLDGLNLPDWMFPHFQNKSSALRGNEPVVTNYFGHISVDPAHDNFRGHLRAVPWRLWTTPAIAWGIFFVGLYGMLLCLCIIVRRQWVDHERLPFPLATVYLALIEQPEPGRIVNALFRARTFWLAFGGVFFIHFINSMHVYYHETWPQIPLHDDMGGILNTQFWSYSTWVLVQGTIYFCIIGICYFLQTKIAFSLWFSVIALNFVKMIAGQANVEYTSGMRQDEIFGACLPFVLTFLWVGRAHWMVVIKQMFRSPRSNEPTGRYLPYFLAGWGAALCAVIMIAWLMAVGASLVGSIVLVLMMVTALMIMARVVAETGLIFVQISLPMTRPWIYMAQNLPGDAVIRTTQQSYFMTIISQTFFAGDMRECMPVFMTNALRVADSAAYEKVRNWKKAIPFTLVLILALVVGYFVSGASMLYNGYTYAHKLDKSGEGPINPHGLLTTPKTVVDQAEIYIPPNDGVKESHNRLAHFTGGAAVCALLSILRLRYVNWPLHPVGALLCNSWTMGVCWQSIFLGWLAKVLVVRFGGRRGFQSARNFFIGLIVGEAAAAAFWLVVSLARLSMGLPYNAITLLPT